MHVSSKGTNIAKTPLAMSWKSSYQALCHYLFIAVTLLGWIAPWVTPRHFPTHTIAIKMTDIEFTLFGTDNRTSLEGNVVESKPEQLEIMQNAC